MDLIDREALYKEICRAYEYEYPTASGAFDEFVSKILKNIIYNAPTVDAVEVVRCKDCEYRGELVCPMFSEEYIWYDGGYAEIDNTEDDAFCSVGMRKDGD